MARTEQLRTIIEPIVAALDADIYDLEFEGGSLRLTLDRPGGIDLDTIAEATRQVSRQLDLDDPIPGAYTLEVTSPGLERRLRTSSHWASAVGETVRVKLRPHVEGERRLEGVVTAVADEHATIDTDDGPVVVAVDDVDRAKTVFIWGPSPKPGGRRPASGAQGSATSDPTPAALAATEESDNR